MPACEKCWGDAYFRHTATGKDQHDCYRELLEERKDDPCSIEDQAGEWWDEENQCDKRHTRAAWRDETKKGESE